MSNCFCHFDGYEVKDAKARANKIGKIINVEALINDPELEVDQVIETLGYYEANDGGGATYIIKSEATPNTKYITLSNGLIAELICNDGFINPKVLGAKGDGVTDDYQAIQEAINYKNVKLDKGNYLLSQPITIGSNKIFDGNKAKLITSPGNYALQCVGTGIDNACVETSIRNVLIDTTNGGNGILIDKCYFIYVDDVNIIALNEDGAIGIHQIDSFNVVITNSRVRGNAEKTNTIGLNIETDAESSINNITNCKYDTLLLQNLTYGVKMVGGTANMNEFNNLGFSNNNYNYHISGYNFPVVIRNSRMEAGSKVTNGEEMYGFYILGNINLTIDSLNAYNIPKVLHSETASVINLEGSISLTGTSQSEKYVFIDKSNSTILNNASINMQSATYKPMASDWNIDNPLVQLSNTNKMRTANVTSNTINAKDFYIGMTYTSSSILNINGIQGGEIYLWTDQSDLKLFGSDNSNTNKWPTTITMEPYKMYHLYNDGEGWIILD